MASNLSLGPDKSPSDSRWSTGRASQERDERPFTPYQNSPSRPISRSAHHRQTVPTTAERLPDARGDGEERHYGLLREVSVGQLLGGLSEIGVLS